MSGSLSATCIALAAIFLCITLVAMGQFVRLLRASAVSASLYSYASRASGHGMAGSGGGAGAGNGTAGNGAGGGMAGEDGLSSPRAAASSSVWGWLCCACLRPLTTQKATHCLVVTAATLRAVFLCMAPEAWSVREGHINPSASDTDRAVFYVLDQLPVLLLLSAYSMVALFWGEIYYRSVDAPAIFYSIVRPLIYALNLCAYVGMVVMWILEDTRWNNEDYSVTHFAVFVSFMYIVLAVMVLWFARSASHELKIVPVDLRLRQQRLAQVELLATVVLVCIGLKVLVLLLTMGRRVYLTSWPACLATFLFFMSTEAVPMVVLLFFYRRTPAAASRDYMDTPDDPMAVHSLLSGRAGPSPASYSAEKLDQTIAHLSLGNMSSSASPPRRAGQQPASGSALGAAAGLSREEEETGGNDSIEETHFQRIAATSSGQDGTPPRAGNGTIASNTPPPI